MSQVRRAICWQLGALLIAITLIAVLSHFFPIVDFVEALQVRVMSWGSWAAICYPLLFAGCNILLLPGGILAVGGGFFFGLWWGFLIVFVGNFVATAISFASMVPAQTFAEFHLARLGTGGRARELEDYSPEPTASSLSNELVELSLWPDPNQVWHLYTLGLNRPSPRALFVYLSRDVGSTGAEVGARAEPAAPDRVLDLGRRLRYNGTIDVGLGPDCVSSNPNIAHFGGSAGPDRPTSGLHGTTCSISLSGSRSEGYIDV
jgi:hypothetical protein